MLFGTEKRTKTLDDNGSTATTTNKFVGGKVVKPIVTEYSIKVRVKNALEEAAEYHSFAKEYHTDKTMLRPSFELDFSRIGNENGYYYIVKRYSREDK